ncbi:MAG: AAA family ATPase [Gallionella sp.]|nr:AAA family ATPase [Gallionella sp.]
MRIKFVEIQNFRKLESIRIDFAEETTLLVGANNSGKTSAMVALGHFLSDKKHFTTNDFTLSNWTEINQIGRNWEGHPSNPPTLAEWEHLLPSIDVWLHVEDNEIHRVSHLLPTLDWKGGAIGVRLRLEPEKLDDLYKNYLSSIDGIKTLKGETANSGACNVTLWPKTMHDYLTRRLGSDFVVRAYTLDPEKCALPNKGIAAPQPLSNQCESIKAPFNGLIRIDQINAQRGFEDAHSKADQADESNKSSDKQKLSEQLRAYYSKHLNPTQFPDASDLVALQAIEEAQGKFNDTLKSKFSASLTELTELGYPGLTDAKLSISSKIGLVDGLNHDAAVQYEVISQTGEAIPHALQLPEQYNGLGYQNLISMFFKLMRFRDDWMQVGKVAKKAVSDTKESSSPPLLHLVLLEEPEAHLHVQVQQVFIRKAYDVLRKHEHLGKNKKLTTQLIVSTHSSHIAHECDFSWLRYFRRFPASELGKVPTSTVVNLSEVFGQGDATEKFVTRYLKATHCDLFFADAAILVEGSAERMLIPHFIRTKFPSLSQCYITLLEIGGSHAHSLRPLLEHLGLITLIITDLDAAESAGHHKSAQPKRGKNQITGNSTLKDWIPKATKIDELLDAQESAKLDEFALIRVAYQIPTQVQLVEAGNVEEALSNTFEDALVFENWALFDQQTSTGLMAKFCDAIQNHKTAAALGEAMFEILKSSKKKAEFSLELLYSDESGEIVAPRYIHEGLSWLQKLLQKQSDTSTLSVIQEGTA